MDMQVPAMHFVCTRDEARELIRGRDRFWVSNCGCREGRGQCDRSRIDLCLVFYDDIGMSGSGGREIALADVEEIFREAETCHLVTRPFRSDDRTRVDGICFCCDDCCVYFLDPSDVCDKGRLVQESDPELCAACGACTEVCYFGARKTDDGELVVDRDECYGCGLCVDVCPEGSIRMVHRQ
jgi:Pyruvate/2-oxoacid:ferredoxin oxidoreductase delta subunit